MDIISKYFDGFTETQMLQYARLKGLYEDWNQKINVISRKDMDDFYEHHVLHSMAIAAVFDFPAGFRVMDLGCGGGFPSIPLAIFFPDVQFRLVDSIQKKLKVAGAIAEGIGLKNISVRHTRVEDIRDEKFDLVISRAVAPLKDLWQWSRPLLKPRSDGPILPRLICLKGGDLSGEIQESGLRPTIREIDSMFQEDYFKDKFILSV